MIRYSVIILPYAEDDISNATDYIAFDKKSPATALNLARGLRKAISSLQTVPYRHEFDEDEERCRYAGIIIRITRYITSWMRKKRQCTYCVFFICLSMVRCCC